MRNTFVALSFFLLVFDMYIELNFDVYNRWKGRLNLDSKHTFCSFVSSFLYRILTRLQDFSFPVAVILFVVLLVFV